MVKISNKEETTVEGYTLQEIVWSFPIAEIQPYNLEVKLGYAFNQDATDLVYVSINGLMHPNTTIPAIGPIYVVKETKDPTLYALSKQMLDAFEDEARGCIAFNFAARESIEKSYGHGSDQSFFRVANWSWTEPRNFSAADANVLFSQLKTKIEHMIPEIESAIVECAKKRPSLMQGNDPVPVGMHRELARLALLDGLVPSSPSRSGRVYGDRKVF